MTIARCFVLLLLSAGICANAQDAASDKPNAPTKMPSAASLGFSNPKIVEDLEASPMIAGRLDCSEDGSIYAFIDVAR